MTVSFAFRFPIETELVRPIPRGGTRRYVGWETDERVVRFPYPLFA